MKKFVCVVVVVVGLGYLMTASYADIVDENEVCFIVSNQPLELLLPTKPTLSWDLCGAIATRADTQKNAECVAGINAQGVGYMEYWAFGHIETSGTDEELVKEFAVFNLDTEGRRVNVDGVPKPGKITEMGAVSIKSRAFLETCVQAFKNMIDAGVVAVCVDEGTGSEGSGYSNDFHPDAMPGFRKFLRKNYTAEELETKFGIKDIDTFDYQKMLKSIVLVVKDSDPLKPGKRLSPEWWKNRIGRVPEPSEKITAKTLGHHHGSIGLPLDDQWRWYGRELVRNFHKEVIERSRAYAAEQGKEWHVYTNACDRLGEPDDMWRLMSLTNMHWGGMWKEYPAAHMSSNYKALRSRGQRFWPGEWPGQVMPPKGKSDNQITATVTFELTVNGMCVRYPGGGEYGERNRGKASEFPAVKAGMDPYFAFVRSHEKLFVKPDSEIGLMYSLSTCASTLRHKGVGKVEYHGAARLLEDAHRSYDVVFVGNDLWVPYDLTLEDLQQYKLIVLPHVRYLSEAQRRLILDYVDKGGLIIAVGDIGTHNLKGNSYPVSKWNSLFDKAGLRKYGKGKIWHFPEQHGRNLAERYGFKGRGTQADLKLFTDTLNSLLPPRLVTDLPRTVAVHRNAHPSKEAVILHLINYDYDLDSDTLKAVKNASMTITLAESMQPDSVRAVYYELANLPDGKQLACETDGDNTITIVLPNVSNWGTLVIE